MPRKNNKDWTSVAIKKAILKKLDKLKVHQNQSYSEVIENLLKSCSTKREVSELKLSKAQSPNISLKDNSNELSQMSNDTSLNNNIKSNFVRGLTSREQLCQEVKQRDID